MFKCLNNFHTHISLVWIIYTIVRHWTVDNNSDENVALLPIMFNEITCKQILDNYTVKNCNPIGILQYIKHSSRNRSAVYLHVMKLTVIIKMEEESYISLSVHKLRQNSLDTSAAVLTWSLRSWQKKKSISSQISPAL